MSWRETSEALYRAHDKFFSKGRPSMSEQEKIPAWLQKLRDEQAKAPKGHIATLRQIAETGQAQTIDELEVPAEAAKMMLKVYDDLCPSGQERFATDLARGFRGVARTCVNLTRGHNTLGPASSMLEGMMGLLGGSGVEIISMGTIMLGPEEAKEFLKGTIPPELLPPGLGGKPPRKKGKRRKKDES
jgi:hypothetical protein